MNRLSKIAFAALLFAGACGDDNTAPAPMPGATPMPAPGAVPMAPAPTTPAPTPAPPGAVPITAWIHDLVHKFGPTSDPDTVEDKVLIDTEDEKAFDDLLPTQ